jgi:flagellar export protein FliJ
MATKDLSTLIRIRKWDVDEKQRAVAALLRREEAILAAQAALEDEVRREAAFVAQGGPNERLTFAAYLAHCDQRKQQMNAALIEVRGLIDQARDELAEAYRGLKTFEVTQKAREAAEERELARQEQMDLDEIGLNLHRHKA